MRGVMHQLSEPGIAPHFDFGDRAFFKFNDRLASAVADHASKKFAQVRIVPHQQHGILPRIFFQHLLKIRKAGLRTQRVLDHQFAFVAHLVSDQSGGLRGSLQRTGDDDLHLHAQRGQSAADVAALLDAVFIERRAFRLSSR